MKYNTGEEMKSGKQWTFITNHGAVLALIGERSMITTREISLHLGITERTVYKILADLETTGYITKSKIGRRNHFIVHPSLPLRQEGRRQVEVGALLQALSRNQNHAQ
jgi:uncharacterized membrane protein